MTMVCGAETTSEEDFLYSQEMTEFLDEWEHEFYFDRTGSLKVFLQDFAWALKQKIDKEGL